MRKRRKIINPIDFQRERHQKAIITIQRWWRTWLHSIVSKPCPCDTREAMRLSDDCILSIDEYHICSNTSSHHVHHWGSLYYWCCQPVTRKMFTRFIQNQHVIYMLFYRLPVFIL